MGLLVLIGLGISFGIAYWLGQRTSGIPVAVGVFVTGVVGGEMSMLAYVNVMNVSDPTTFPAGQVIGKAIGLVWMAFIGSGFGLWRGRKKSQGRRQG